MRASAVWTEPVSLFRLNEPFLFLCAIIIENVIRFPKKPKIQESSRLQNPRHVTIFINSSKRVNNFCEWNHQIKKQVDYLCDELFDACNNPGRPWKRWHQTTGPHHFYRFHWCQQHELHFAGQFRSFRRRQLPNSTQRPSTSLSSPPFCPLIFSQFLAQLSTNQTANSDSILLILSRKFADAAHPPVNILRENQLGWNNNSEYIWTKQVQENGTLIFFKKTRKRYVKRITVPRRWPTVHRRVRTEAHKRVDWGNTSLSLELVWPRTTAHMQPSSFHIFFLFSICYMSCLFSSASPPLASV